MDADAYRGLEPVQLWRQFAALNAIPRPSGQEAAARDYVLEVAERAGAAADVDARGNTIVRVDSPAGTAARPVAVQGHLDMVCDAEPGVSHDWARDPVVPRREGDLIFGSGTTLGADNGIGVAACLALIDAEEVRHNGLELLFTVDEESGRWGALDLDATLLDSETLINLDSEDSDALTIGSAGGCGLEIAMPLQRESPPAGARGVELRLQNLRGGHSGVQIHERRANAIKLLTQVVRRIQAATPGLRLDSMQGGSTATAIARRARAGLTIGSDEVATTEALVERIRDELRESWAADEPGLELELEARPEPESVLVESSTARLLALLEELPHGVLAQSPDFTDTVETSANLACLEVTGERTLVIAGARSLSPAKLREVEDTVRDVARRQGAEMRILDPFPGWEPRPDSPLVEAARAAYRATYGRDPRLDVLHGGLECGAIVAAKPDLDAISFGPTIVGAHTPEEHVHASTVLTTWQLLIKLLDRLANA